MARLAARKVPYDLRRLRDRGPTPGDWQLFFFDPNGARIEIDLPADEPELGEQSPNDATHHHQRQEHRRQRQGDRSDGEADLASTVE